VPLVVRLNGNAADEGKKSLLEWGKANNFNMQVADNMGDAAKKAAATVNK
jgi:succinyl-CoA synthetase beta subunit